MSRTERMLPTLAALMLLVAIAVLAWNQYRLDQKYDLRYEWSSSEILSTIDYVNRLRAIVIENAEQPASGQDAASHAPSRTERER